jgi:protein-disulfide isomerase
MEALMRFSVPTATARAAIVCAVILAATSSLGFAAEENPEVMAKIGNTEIAKEEVLDAAASELRELEQQRHEILRQTVEMLVNQKLIERAAEAEGQEVRAYVESAITPHVSEPTEEEIKALYEQVKDRIGGRTLEQIRPRIVQKLRDDQRQQAYQKLIDQLRAEAEVEVLIEPYRVEISADDDPFRGPADAPVTIVEFSDYQCPYCERAEGVVDQVLERYDDQVRVVFRDLPLESLHPDAPKAHEAAGCALEQESFWPMHEKLFANRRNLDRESLVQYATELELDVDAFTTCLEEGRRADEVAEDIAAARAQGISGTPAFFINGRLISGAQPFERFEEIIDDELRRKGLEPPKPDEQASAAATP